jgi:hypothetical protein
MSLWRNYTHVNSQIQIRCVRQHLIFGHTSVSEIYLETNLQNKTETHLIPQVCELGRASAPGSLTWGEFPTPIFTTVCLLYVLPVYTHVSLYVYALHYFHKVLLILHKYISCVHVYSSFNIFIFVSIIYIIHFDN